ncbi:hypothetical protein LMJ38_09635 [Streptomyces sp. R1]|uniref:hypothetical protein n=1 Tax=Streptomyces sp. R1 TaxID=1509279 RepID=UPI001E5D829A|nr:hypothetical protein [Streptomyces sp. R1]MCC8336196.1 hypothetical protein [Streptomyces sp. R1]
MASSEASARPRVSEDAVREGSSTASTPSRSAPSRSGNHAVMPPPAADSSTRSDCVRYAQPARESSTGSAGATAVWGTRRRCWMSTR